MRQQQAFVDPRVVEPDGGRREPGVLFVDRGPGRVAAVLLAAHQVGDLLAELLPRGAVQAEVDGVVDVHEQLRHRLGQLELGRRVDVVLLLVPEGRDDQGDVHGQGGEQEGEGHGEQHDGELGAFPGPRGSATAGDASVPVLHTVGVETASGHLLVVVVLGRVLHSLPVGPSFDHLADDEDVEDNDDDERHKGVDERVDPGPDLVDEVLVVRSRLAVGHVLAVHGPLHDLHGPQKVQVDGEHDQHEKTDHLLGAARVDHGGGFERETDHDVALHSDGDDQPD